MHFWLPEIPHPEREEIHNHRYDFSSIVLAGHLMHEVWHLDKVRSLTTAVQEQDWEIFETNCAPNKEGTVETVTPCLITKMGEFNLGAGSLYTFPHTSFHTTEGTRFAITHLTRVLPKPLEYASVIKKQGAATTCPFRDKIPAKQCWEYIDAALIRGAEEFTRIIPCMTCGKPCFYGEPEDNTTYLCWDCGMD